jgi:hypothetical protein
MISRKDAVTFIKTQFSAGYYSREDKGGHHYGVCELKDLMDVIYGGAPEGKHETITVDCTGYQYRIADKNREERAEVDKANKMLEDAGFSTDFRFVHDRSEGDRV